MAAVHGVVLWALHMKNERIVTVRWGEDRMVLAVVETAGCSKMLGQVDMYHCVQLQMILRSQNWTCLVYRISLLPQSK